MQKKRIKLKKCTKCKKEFPATREYFYYLNKKENILEWHCISCKKKRNKNYCQKNKDKLKKYALEYYKENKDKLNEKKRMLRKSGFKICAECKKKFPDNREYFYYQNKKENILNSWCISCVKRYKKEYYLKNKG
jgi:hypothetical protein